MFNSGNDFTMPVVPAGYANGNNGMFGGDGWWAIIIFALIFGWGGNGFGGFGGNGAGLQGALTRGDLCQDMNFNNLEAAVRGVQSGLCDGFYAVNTTLLNGFAGVDNAICSLGYQAQQGFNSTNMAIAQLGFQNQQCCCEINRNVDAVRFENAQNTCAITNAIHAEGEQTRALINANTMQDLRDKLAEKDRDVLARDFQLSQIAQTTSIVDQVRPCPQPAYITCNPWGYNSGYGYNGYGYNNGCGCGNNNSCGCC